MFTPQQPIANNRENDIEVHTTVSHFHQLLSLLLGFFFSFFFFNIGHSPPAVLYASSATPQKKLICG